MASKSLKQCYYEVLGIDKEAAEEEVKKAYRVMALKWHPDKNPDNPDASLKFRDIQAAYDVLSDIRERAWYDKHRDEILRGRSEHIQDDQSFDVIPYCISSCFSGFNDSDTGFYTIYRFVFDALTKEDLPYQEESDPVPPSFGNAKTPYEEVHTFYSHWQAYSTPKTYMYLGEFNVSDAPNRRILRLMEKDNNKLRDTAKKERNQEIRVS